jgi:hypothetical protein
METVTMSYEELDRVRVIERVIERRLTQREAARMLALTDRQVRRLRRRYERDGREAWRRDIAAGRAIGGWIVRCAGRRSPPSALATGASARRWLTRS